MWRLIPRILNSVISPAWPGISNQDGFGQPKFTLGLQALSKAPGLHSCMDMFVFRVLQSLLCSTYGSSCSGKEIWILFFQFFVKIKYTLDISSWKTCIYDGHESMLLRFEIVKFNMWCILCKFSLTLKFYSIINVLCMNLIFLCMKKSVANIY